MSRKPVPKHPPHSARPRPPRPGTAARNTPRAAHQPVLPQGPARQLRQTRPHADPGAHQHRGRHAAGLGRCATGTKTCCRARRRGEPFPQVVGITVHLTFAARAFELARWYRERGAQVVLGGLHVLSCPDECAPHADALAVGEGVQLWPQILRDVEAGALKPRYRGSYRAPYRDDPPPRRDLLPRDEFPHDHQPDRHARLPQPLRLLLPLDRGAAHALPDARPASRSPPRSAPTASRTACSSTTTSARGPNTCAAVPRAAAAGENLERGGYDRRDRRPVAGARDGAGRLHRRVHRLRVARQPTTSPTRARRAPTRATTRGACASCTTTASR